jgi:hypothetical protein
MEWQDAGQVSPGSLPDGDAGRADDASGPSARKRRTRQRRRRVRNKPYDKMTWEEKLRYDEVETRRGLVAAAHASMAPLPVDKHGRVKAGVRVQDYRPDAPRNTTEVCRWLPCRRARGAALCCAVCVPSISCADVVLSCVRVFMLLRGTVCILYALHVSRRCCEPTALVATGRARTILPRLH